MNQGGLIRIRKIKRASQYVDNTGAQTQKSVTQSFHKADRPSLEKTFLVGRDLDGPRDFHRRGNNIERSPFKFIFPGVSRCRGSDTRDTIDRLRGSRDTFYIREIQKN